MSPSLRMIALTLLAAVSLSLGFIIPLRDSPQDNAVSNEDLPFRYNLLLDDFNVTVSNEDLPFRYNLLLDDFNVTSEEDYTFPPVRANQITAKKLSDYFSKDIVDPLTAVVSRVRGKRDVEPDSEEDEPIHYNDIVDLLIELAVETMKKKNMRRVSIPDITEGFVQSLAFVKVEAEFRAWNGWVEDLQTLERHGDVKVHKDGSLISIEGGLGLRDLKVGFDNYSAKLASIGPTGYIRMDVDSNSIRLNLSMHLTSEEKCEVRLNDVTVTKLEGLTVQMNGLRPLNGVLSSVTTYFVERSSDRVKRAIQRHLAEVISSQLEKYECDKGVFHALSEL